MKIKSDIVVMFVILSLVFFLSPRIFASQTSEPVLPAPFLVYGNNAIDSSLPDSQGNISYSLDVNEPVRERLVLRDNERKDTFNKYIISLNSSPGYHGPEMDGPDQLVNDVSIIYRNIGRPAKFSAADTLALPSNLGDTVRMGFAFLTNLAVHELGHAVVADYVGAKSNRLDFFKKQGNTFFLGTSTARGIDNRSDLPYTMGGEFFADLTFEHALQNYRKNPGNVYNKSLLFYSGTDFLWYCMYAFYLSDPHPNYDPVSVAEQTGISRDMLFSVALAKTMINMYRIYTGEDRVIPYFTVDRYSAMLNLAIPFEIDKYIGKTGFIDNEVL